MVHNPRPVRQYVKVHDKTQDLYQDTNWSYDQIKINLKKN